MGPQSCYSRDRPAAVYAAGHGASGVGCWDAVPQRLQPLLLPTGNSSSKKGLTVELQNVIERVRGEFNEMPGLRLTPEQAARLWGLDAGSCNQVLRSLVSSSFLRWSAGSVVRAA